MLAVGIARSRKMSKLEENIGGQLLWVIDHKCSNRCDTLLLQLELKAAAHKKATGIVLYYTVLVRALRRTC